MLKNKVTKVELNEVISICKMALLTCTEHPETKERYYDEMTVKEALDKIKNAER